MNSLEQPPDTYTMSGAEVIDGQLSLSGPRGAETLEATPSRDILGDEPDYIEKLTMTPLPIATLSGLFEQAVSGGETFDVHTVEFGRQLVTTMRDLLGRLAQDTTSGDYATFDDVMMAAQFIAGQADRVGIEHMRNSPSQYVAEADAMERIYHKFAQAFEAHPELEYIGDNIDKFTIHSAVHPYQKERAENRPNESFYGEGYGCNERWIPEKMVHGVTVMRDRG